MGRAFKWYNDKMIYTAFKSSLFICFPLIYTTLLARLRFLFRVRSANLEKPSCKRRISPPLNSRRTQKKLLSYSG